jgi:hypothetical protein
MVSRTRQRRRQLDRAGIAEHLDTSIASVNRWHRQRATSGFPTKADTDRDGRDWWWQDDIDAFRLTHLVDRAAQYTPVDRHGDPGDLLNGPQAAKVLGYRDHRSLPAYLLEHPNQIDEYPSGLKRRYWYRRTLWAWADERAIRRSTGHPTGPSGSGQPHPYAGDRLRSRRPPTEAHASGRITTAFGRTARSLGISLAAPCRLLRTSRPRPQELIFAEEN